MSANPTRHHDQEHAPHHPHHEHPLRTSPEIDPDLVLQKLRSEVDLIIVDVRDSSEFRQGHIPTSRSIPLHRLSGACFALVSHHPAALIVVSRSGFRAQTAASALAMAGYGPVLVLAGGINRWRDRGHPIEDTSRAREQQASPFESAPPNPFLPRGPSSYPPRSSR